MTYFPELSSLKEGLYTFVVSEVDVPKLFAEARSIPKPGTGTPAFNVAVVSTCAATESLTSTGGSIGAGTPKFMIVFDISKDQ